MEAGDGEGGELSKPRFLEGKMHPPPSLLDKASGRTGTIRPEPRSPAMSTVDLGPRCSDRPTIALKNISFY